MGETIYQGDDETIRITVEDTDGNAYDLTDVDLVWALSRSRFNNSVLSKTEGSGLTVTDAVNGKAEVDLTQSDTEGLDTGGYIHEVELTDTSGAVTSVPLTPALTIDPDIAD